MKTTMSFLRSDLVTAWRLSLPRLSLPLHLTDPIIPRYHSSSVNNYCTHTQHLFSPPTYSAEYCFCLSHLFFSLSIKSTLKMFCLSKQTKAHAKTYLWDQPFDLSDYHYREERVKYSQLALQISDHGENHHLNISLYSCWVGNR